MTGKLNRTKYHWRRFRNRHPKLFAGFRIRLAYALIALVILGLTGGITAGFSLQLILSDWQGFLQDYVQQWAVPIATLAVVVVALRSLRTSQRSIDVTLRSLTLEQRKARTQFSPILKLNLLESTYKPPDETKTLFEGYQRAKSASDSRYLVAEVINGQTNPGGVALHIRILVWLWALKDGTMPNWDEWESDWEPCPQKVEELYLPVLESKGRKELCIGELGSIPGYVAEVKDLRYSGITAGNLGRVYGSLRLVRTSKGYHTDVWSMDD